MPLGNPIPGMNYAAEFQVSSIPFVTSSVLGSQETRVVRFYNVSKSVCVRSATTNANNMKVAFTQNGLSDVFANYVSLVPGESFTADARVIDLWLSGSNNIFTVYADLTSIQRNMYTMGLTGSNGIDGVG